MPKPAALKPTIYFRGGYWRVREPMPRPYSSPEAKLWPEAHSWCPWANNELFALLARSLKRNRV